VITNADIMRSGGGRLGAIYRTLVAVTPGGHDALCDAYGLDRDNGGTHYSSIVEAAYSWGDLDPETGELT